MDKCHFNTWSARIDGRTARIKPGQIKTGDTVRFSHSEVGSHEDRDEPWNLSEQFKGIIVSTDIHDVKILYTDESGAERNTWLPINRITKVFGRNHAYTD